eukprot:m.50757 g.50757  ORF g.50757 m.50757 type:complete len:155 (-) comp12933_c0_seq2:73-537(-)
MLQHFDSHICARISLQAKTEEEHFMAMHTKFQRDLYMLRLNAARYFAKTVSENLQPVATNAVVSLKVNAQAFGLGPKFRIVVKIKNDCQTIADDVRLVLSFDTAMYRLCNPACQSWSLPPGFECQTAIMIECIQQAPIATPVNVYVMHRECPGK